MIKKIWKKFVKIQYEYWYEEDLNKVNSEIEKLKNQIESLKEKIITLKRVYEIDEPNEPEKLGEISVFELKKLLAPYCNDIYLSDRMYGLTSVAQAKKFSEETKVFVRQWVREQHDCDEFSFALMGYWNDGLKQFAFGIAWSSPHAFNIFVDNNKQVWIVEPQSNKFMKIEDIKNNNKYYPLRLILI